MISAGSVALPAMWRKVRTIYSTMVASAYRGSAYGCILGFEQAIEIGGKEAAASRGRGGRGVAGSDPGDAGYPLACPACVGS